MKAANFLTTRKAAYLLGISHTRATRHAPKLGAAKFNGRLVWDFSATLQLAVFFGCHLPTVADFEKAAATEALS